MNHFVFLYNKYLLVKPLLGYILKRTSIKTFFKTGMKISQFLLSVKYLWTMLRHLPEVLDFQCTSLIVIVDSPTSDKLSDLSILLIVQHYSDFFLNCNFDVIFYIFQINV